jgi:hypothetical protein
MPPESPPGCGGREPYGLLLRLMCENNFSKRGNMKRNLVPTFLVAVALAASVLLVACSGDSDNGDADPSGSPAPAFTETPASSPTEGAQSPVALPATPTAEPETATSEPDDDCPIETVVCNIADSLDVALDQGNYGAIVELMQGREETCPGGAPQGAGGPFPLCEGAQQGEKRTGYQLSRRYSEGYFPGRDGVVLFLEGFVNAASPDVTDAYGSGELRLQAVSCVTPAGDNCEEAAIIFTAILDGNHREVMAFYLPLPADPAAPISRAQSGIVLEDEEQALFETGGEVMNFGQVYVLSE